MLELPSKEQLRAIQHCSGFHHCFFPIFELFIATDKMDLYQTKKITGSVMIILILLIVLAIERQTGLTRMVEKAANDRC